MEKEMKKALPTLLLTVMSTAGSVIAQQEDETYSPYAKGYPQRVLFGDTHVHTAISNDAYGAGNRLGPEEAYRFARGEEIVTSHGERVRLNQPLDFLVIADHAEAYGAFQQIDAANPKMMTDPRVREWHELLKAGTREAEQKLAEAFANAMLDRSLPEVLFDADLLKSMWSWHLGITEKYNEPGRFTAFHGYEWSSTPKGANLHRVVIFKDGADKVGQINVTSPTGIQEIGRLDGTDLAAQIWDAIEAKLD